MCIVATWSQHIDSGTTRGIWETGDEDGKRHLFEILVLCMRQHAGRVQTLTWMKDYDTGNRRQRRRGDVEFRVERSGGESNGKKASYSDTIVGNV